jgi:hypothetical protein
MTERDRLHAAAVELAESIAARLRRHEPESTLLDDAARLGQMLRQLAALDLEARS